MSIIYKTGDRISDCTLLDCAGYGGFGEVWRAKNDDGKTVALKIITNIKDGNREFNSILKLQKCEHDSLIKIDNIGITTDEYRFLYYFMPLADNIGTREKYIPDTLRSRLCKKGKLPPETLYEIAEKIANALGTLHKAGFIHRDVKPDNIIFIDGKPVLADIGLVTTSDVYTSRAGTYDFLPPYVLNKTHEQCPASDFYAFGMTLLCALYGTDNPEDACRRCRYDSKSLNGFSLDIVNLYGILEKQSKNFPQTKEEKKEFIDSPEKFLAVLHITSGRTKTVSTKSRTRKTASPAEKDYQTLLEKLYEQDIYTAPNIPEKKLKNAIRSFAPGIKAEDVLLLADDTVLGSAENGLLLTKDALYGKEIWEKPKKISLFRNTAVSVKESKTLCINNYEFISLTCLKDKYPKLRAVIQAVCASHSDSFDGVSKPEILPKQKSGCLKKIMIFAVCWILLGIIGTYWEEKEKKEKSVQETKTPKLDADSIPAVQQSPGKQPSKTERAVPVAADKSGKTAESKSLLEKYPLSSEMQSEVRKLMEEYKLSPEEEKLAAGYLQGINQQIDSILKDLDTFGIDSLRALLQTRKHAVKRYKNSQKKIPAGKKAEEVPEIKALLEKYHWFDTKVKTEMESNPTLYLISVHSISVVQKKLQEITSVHQYTDQDLQNLENRLKSMNAQFESAKKVIRFRQHPEIKKLTDEFAIPPHIAKKMEGRMSQIILKQMAEKGKITNSEFDSLRFFLKHEWKKAQEHLLLENKLAPMAAGKEKIFSAKDKLQVTFRYFENNSWHSQTTQITGVENEYQLEKQVLKTPVFRFDQSMDFHICKVIKLKFPEQKYRVNYQFRKNKRENWQTLQEEMTSVPTIKIARNALFWQHAENAPECEIKVQKLEKNSEQLFNLGNLQLQKKSVKTEQYIDLSEILTKPFSTDALTNNRNNSYLADFYNFWSHEYIKIPQRIQDDLSYKLELWKRENFKKIPQEDALYAEFVKREIQLVNAANTYCQKYGKAHQIEESRKDFAQLVLMMEMRKTALQQLEINLKPVGAPARRYKPIKVY